MPSSLQCINRNVERLANTLAVLGTLALLVVVGMTVVSILGRELAGLAQAEWVRRYVPILPQLASDSKLGGITGDYEITAMLVAFVVFTYLPSCQLQHGHISITLVSQQLPTALQRYLIAFWEVSLTLMLMANNLAVVSCPNEQIRLC